MSGGGQLPSDSKGKVSVMGPPVSYVGEALPVAVAVAVAVAVVVVGVAVAVLVAVAVVVLLPPSLMAACTEISSLAGSS